jgi:hypothetical protein
MAHYKDISGQKFGRLTAVEYRGTNYRHSAMWLCVCECGKEHVVDRNCLIKGTTRSCGCLNQEVRLSGANRATHGLGKTRLYRIWKKMKSRCHNPNDPNYSKWYGAHGIQVCPAWRNDFLAFYQWATANGYADDLSIDRIDPFGNYEPDNCRWATALEQVRNKRGGTAREIA